MEKILKTVRLFFQAHMESAVSRNSLDMCSWWLFIIAYSIFSESELNILPAQTAVGYPPYFIHLLTLPAISHYLKKIC